MSLGSLSSADKARLQNLINEGVQILSDVHSMKEGLKETVEAVAEEMEIKKAVLNKAIQIAFKNSQNKKAYMYFLTPKGMAEKMRATTCFLQIKMNEYEALQREIEILRNEIRK